MYFNPERRGQYSEQGRRRRVVNFLPPPVSAVVNRAQRDRRLQELLDRRQTLVSQIEQLRSARELLFAADDRPAAAPYPSSSSRRESAGASS